VTEVAKRDDAKVPDDALSTVGKPVLSVLRKNKELIESIAKGVLAEERVLRMVNAAIRLNPSILECSPLSVLNAVVYITYLGLEIGPESAYILTFRDRKSGGKRVAAPVIDYRAKIRLAATAGIFFDDPEIVYVADNFRRWTDEHGKHFLHEPKEAEDRGERVGVYVGVRWQSEYRITYMPASEIAAVKTAALARTGNSGPWVDHESRMWSKTVIHRAFKTLPRPVDSHLAEVIRKSQDIDYANDQGEPVELLIQGDFEDEKPIVPTGTPEQQQEVARQKIEDLQNGKQPEVAEDTAARYEAENEANREKAREADAGRKPLRFGRKPDVT
jgi:recombination protein RecT